MSTVYSKEALDILRQISLLKERGLIISNEDEASLYLKNISYYRLSAYMLPFQKNDRTSQHHTFLEGTTLRNIIDVYVFDRKLRNLTMDALARIETSVKSVIINEMCVPYGTHWYMNSEHFSHKFDHDTFIEIIKKDIGYGQDVERIRDICIQHYYRKYDSPALPPLWMISESLTFGKISKLYSGLPRADKNRIASNYEMPERVFGSALRSTSYIRNLCAHHSRLWNRICTIKPIKVEHYYGNEFQINTMFYTQAVILNLLMNTISPETEWSQRLKLLFEEYPQIDKLKMGFPDNWKDREVWNLRHHNKPALKEVGG